MPAQIDPNIALGVKPSTFDPAQSLGQMYALKNAGVRNQIEAQQQQLQQYQLQQAGQQQQDAQAGRAAITANTQTDPTTGIPTLNRAGYLGQLATTAPGQYLGAAQSFTAQDIANAKATADYKKTQLENAKAHTDYVGSLLQGVTDQASYTSALNAAQSAGIVKPGEMPAVYDPQLVQRQLAQTMTQKDVIDQQMKAADAAETARHNKATELSTQNTSLQQGKATAIYAKDPSQRTPEENAFIKGYEKNVQITKTDPGMARMQVLMQMPTQITDPNDPSRTVYATRAGAIGQEAPASGDAAAARHMDTYMTSGKGGQQLNAFNTAQQHLQVLGQAAEALHNGNSTMLNSVANSFAKQTGSPAPTNFDAVKNAVQGEIAKALTGTATVSEQAELQKDMNNASSPAQIAGIVHKYTQLMQGKKDALHQQYTDAKKGQPSFDMPTASPQSGLGVKLSDAMALPQNRGKSADQVTADIVAHGHKVIQ